jgi:hypothetical protein
MTETDEYEYELWKYPKSLLRRRMLLVYGGDF